METATKKVLKVELFQVEMPSNENNSCSACDNVHDELVSAIQDVQKLFDNLDCKILFKSTTVKTIEEAEKAQIIASPTIKVGNFYFYPNHSTGNSDIREWIWNGLTKPEPTKEMLIEILLKGYLLKEEQYKKEISPYVLKYLEENKLTNSDCRCS
ncbi:hypothetical protein DN752_04145 [Echinicola strongylocentroti]|uniref:DUF2703 domain-containing protein n=1 Tax=Echinicola strongylocentroti TaxID=1795355 RepID=A0A2Z4IFY1_9BACT|nr:DUF2703 domain-containing protein [Echinicola strongylocentroti]AWW29398.1 hypothetical protein DN752_04145 [Echinicola strongylocentroti]